MIQIVLLFTKYYVNFDFFNIKASKASRRALYARPVFNSVSLTLSEVRQ
jgi:hypothetical protein